MEDMVKVWEFVWTKEKRNQNFVSEDAIVYIYTYKVMFNNRKQNGKRCENIYFTTRSQYFFTKFLYRLQTVIFCYF